MPSKISIDTGVFVEFIDELGDFHSEATSVVNSVISGKTVGLIVHPVFVELYYISARLYEKIARSKEPEGYPVTQRSERLVRWLFASPNVIIPQNNPELAIEAGIIKNKYSLALTDSCVIAAAKLNDCKVVFKGPEEEMRRGDRVSKIKKAEKVEIVFLNEYV